MLTLNPLSDTDILLHSACMVSLIALGYFLSIADIPQSVIYANHFSKLYTHTNVFTLAEMRRVAKSRKSIT